MKLCLLAIDLTLISTCSCFVAFNFIMLRMVTVALVAALVFLCGTVNGKETSACVLEKTKTAKAIDLTPLASKTNYVVNSATTQGNSYQFNLCAAMHNAAAPCTSSSMVCEYTNSQATANYGAIDNIQVSRGSGNIAAILVSKGDACPTLLGAKSTATFNFVCDSSVKTPTFKLLEDLPNQCKVTIQVTSKYACPGSGGGSIGTVLVAVFIGVLALYFIAGAGLMYRQGHGGSELIVHKTFWCGLPGLIGVRLAQDSASASCASDSSAILIFSCFASPFPCKQCIGPVHS
eukprot:m.146016 g.146016  ORF g.146016 m.146016 type:complete len:290 (-) comp14148_c1_seq4:101-970(-)